MAAAAAVFDGLAAGSRVLAPQVSYLGVRKLLAEKASKGALEVERVDQTDTESTIAAIGDADLVWSESPNNPLVGITDLAALSAAAHERGARFAVDATLATPLLQRSLELGADFVVHSATKYLAGHADSLLGVVVCPDAAGRDELIARRAMTGALPGPLEVYLALRGVRTLALRVERSQANAAELAPRLVSHPAVSRVRYPGLADDPGHELASRQMSGFGAMIAFEVGSADDGPDAAEAVCHGSAADRQRDQPRRGREPGRAPRAVPGGSGPRAREPDPVLGRLRARRGSVDRPRAGARGRLDPQAATCGSKPAANAATVERGVRTFTGVSGDAATASP